jgi:hypothetical protein
MTGATAMISLAGASFGFWTRISLLFCALQITTCAAAICTSHSQQKTNRISFVRSVVWCRYGLGESMSRTPGTLRVTVPTRASLLRIPATVYTIAEVHLAISPTGTASWIVCIRT